MTSEPLVSVVMAAYNRADVMRLAIRSLVQSDYRNWELLVIGDGCTDHSGDVVSEFADPRISFENLPDNTGGQAAPNNRGIERARGEFVLFLNQDDFYLPWHIGRSVRHLQDTGAGISWCPVVLVDRCGKASGPADPKVDRLILNGAVNIGGYDPRGFYLASSWAARRRACDIIGPWKAENERRITPSQDWLFRAARSGLPVSYRPDPSVVAIHAGRRRLSYQRPSAEHDRVWSWIEGGPQSIAAMFAAAASTLGSDLFTAQKSLRKKVERQINEVSEFFGIHTDELRRFLDGEATGDFIQQIRSHAIGSRMLEPGVAMQAGENASDAFFSSGWHYGEGSHRWTCAPRAHLVFSTRDGADVLELTLAPLEKGQVVKMVVDGGAEIEAGLDDVTTLAVPLTGRQAEHQVAISVDRCKSPAELEISSDTRPLGVSLKAFRVVAGV